MNIHWLDMMCTNSPATENRHLHAPKEVLGVDILMLKLEKSMSSACAGDMSK